MDLILWRHADAEDPGPKGDFARELTKKGHKQAKRMAEWLAPRLTGDWRIICSPAARAIQTVSPLGREYEVVPGLDPGHSARDLLREAGWPGDGNVLVVGHNPTLAEVAAMLVGGRGDVSFRKGAVWWFSSRGEGDTVLKAVMAPDLVET